MLYLQNLERQKKFYKTQSTGRRRAQIQHSFKQGFAFF